MLPWYVVWTACTTMYNDIILILYYCDTTAVFRDLSYSRGPPNTLNTLSRRPTADDHELQQLQVTFFSISPRNAVPPISVTLQQAVVVRRGDTLEPRANSNRCCGFDDAASVRRRGRRGSRGLWGSGASTGDLDRRQGEETSTSAAATTTGVT